MTFNSVALVQSINLSFFLVDSRLGPAAVWLLDPFPPVYIFVFRVYHGVRTQAVTALPARVILRDAGEAGLEKTIGGLSPGLSDEVSVDRSCGAWCPALHNMCPPARGEEKESRGRGH